MRVSLLLKQEPFGEILEKTLEKYWGDIYQKKHVVCFLKCNQYFLAKKSSNSQSWLGNIYLNFFTIKQTPVSTFDNLKSEYQYTSVRWRKWAQRVYVYCALHPLFRKYLAQLRLEVTPAVSHAEDMLILGGNRRLRLLHPARGRSIVILKYGYPHNYITEEIKLRKQFQLDFIPKLYLVAEDKSWYEEAYMKGTPLNRIGFSRRNKIAHKVHIKLLNQLIIPTKRAVNLKAYIEAVASDIERFDPENAVMQLLQKLQFFANKRCLENKEIPIAMTHGDFQDANILYDNEQFVVIDWECVALRHAAYDLLVYQLGVRQTIFWSRQIEQLTQYLKNATWDCWPGFSSAEERFIALFVFLIDELKGIVLENYEVPFRKRSTAFTVKLNELSKALVILDAT